MEQTNIFYSKELEEKEDAVRKLFNLSKERRLFRITIETV